MPLTLKNLYNFEVPKMPNMKPIKRCLAVTLTIAVLSPLLALSQNQPNNLRLEQWTQDVPNSGEYYPNEWATTDLGLQSPSVRPDESVKRITTSSLPGDFAARLEVVGLNTGPGVVSVLDGFMNQPVEIDVYPDSATFSFRSDVISPDSSYVVFQIFKYDQTNSERNFIGISETFITGTTNNWQRVTAPYRYDPQDSANLNPDSVLISVYSEASADPNSSAFDGTEGTYLDVNNVYPVEFDAGKGDSIAVCASNTQVDLVKRLKGDVDTIGGIWRDLSGTNALNNGILDVSQVSDKQTYEFEYVDKSFSSRDTALLKVFVKPEPSPMIQSQGDTCETVQQIDLAQLASFDQNFQINWRDLDNSNILNGSVVQPANLDNQKLDDTFRYVIEAQNSCKTVRDTFNLTINKNRNVGQDNAVSVCLPTNNTLLTDYLDGNPDEGGNWIDLDNTGALNGSNIDFAALEQEKDFNFRYIVNQEGCTEDTAELTVEARSTPNSGRDSSLFICETQENVTLLDYLRGDPDTEDATWVDNDQTNALEDGVFKTTQVALNDRYKFSYIVTDQVCRDDTATLSIFINQELDPGMDTATNVSKYRDSVNLNQFINLVPDSNFRWVDRANTGALFDTHYFDATEVSDGDSYQFNYVVSTKGCEDQIATVDVEVEDRPITGITDRKASQNQVYPNPVDDVLYIQNQGSGKVFKLYSLKGDLLTRKAIRGNGNQINVNGFEDGLYIYKLQDRNGNIVSSGKISIIH